jgi:hypothetical protein
VSLPNEPDKADWGFTGQMLSVPVTVSMSISDLKDKLSGLLGTLSRCAISVGRGADQTVRTGGMPPAKMKLKMDPVGFLRDQGTLAQINVAPNAVIAVAAKERGGRGKK